MEKRYQVHYWVITCLAVGVAAIPASAAEPTTMTVLHAFADSGDGIYPYAGLVADTSGALYGMTPYRGSSPGPHPAVPADHTGSSRLFISLPVMMDERPLRVSSWTSRERSMGRHCTAATTISALCSSWRRREPHNGAWTERVLHSFTGDQGYQPGSNLVVDDTGTLYGTTQFDNHYSGTAFSLAPPSKGSSTCRLSVLHYFGQNDGAYPYSNRVRDARTGALYGTTYSGGSGDDGTVFELVPPQTANGQWTETVLHSFAGSDGTGPIAGLIIDKASALYGATTGGGSNKTGTVFKLTLPATVNANWALEVLSNGTGNSDSAAQPYGNLVFDPTHAGVLYGTTTIGGIRDDGSSMANGGGTVFELTPATSNIAARS
jgi:uncharacterized repeat protein (TIGR03803 family)